MVPRTFRASFRLKASTIASTIANGTSSVLHHLPADAQIIVVGDLHESEQTNRRVEIEWSGQRLEMFAVDALDRGEPI